MESSFRYGELHQGHYSREANNCNRKLPASLPQSGLHDALSNQCLLVYLDLQMGRATVDQREEAPKRKADGERDPRVRSTLGV
uniref:Uncharacterized protein n=1 Tax=Tanacetum cinerariifolium TaxID=118510 RepID=A0A699KZS0_TANCI|nr:hypothetical protein [Tanacetum cinerariifolium]